MKYRISYETYSLTPRELDMMEFAQHPVTKANLALLGLPTEFEPTVIRDTIVELESEEHLDAMKAIIQKGDSCFVRWAGFDKL